jgi:hypothetical protein
MMTPLRAALILALTLAATAAHAEACRDTLGATHARRLVDQCLEVSPATHPPCNATNACDLITDEISRGCKMLGNDAPPFCKDY